MVHYSPSQRYLLPVVAAIVAACGGDTAPCRQPPGAAVRAAVGSFVSAPTPKPVRFLAATDAPLPAEGMRALQDRGPTYFFPPDSANQVPVRLKLGEAGSWPTLLVRFHGVQAPAASEAIVTLSGRYVGGEHEGREVPRVEISVGCGADGWTVENSAPQTDA